MGPAENRPKTQQRAPKSPSPAQTVISCETELPHLQENENIYKFIQCNVFYQMNGTVVSPPVSSLARKTGRGYCVSIVSVNSKIHSVVAAACRMMVVLLAILTRVSVKKISLGHSECCCMIWIIYSIYWIHHKDRPVICSSRVISSSIHID